MIEYMCFDMNLKLYLMRFKNAIDSVQEVSSNIFDDYIIINSYSFIIDELSDSKIYIYYTHTNEIIYILYLMQSKSYYLSNYIEPDKLFEILQSWFPKGT